jgi:hypothetical protein
MELILKMVFKFLWTHTNSFFEQPGKIRRIFKAKLVPLQLSDNVFRHAEVHYFRGTMLARRT